jgi:hypothetical protein
MTSNGGFYFNTSGTTAEKVAQLEAFVQTAEGHAWFRSKEVQECLMPMRDTTSSRANGWQDTDDRDTETYGNFDSVRKAWKDDFSGSSLAVFHRVVNAAERDFSTYSHYAKLMTIVQSSGAGKSRLLDEYSKTTTGIIFTLRHGQQGGYPPGDVEITERLRYSALGSQSNLTAHATIIAVLASAVKLGMCNSVDLVS